MQIFPKRGSPACPSDWQRQIVNSNCSETPYPRDTPFHRLFEEQADRSPEAWAIEAVSGRLTYRELNARANQLAARLLSRGVGPEVLVGICLESSPHLLVALLAVLKAGGAYVPLDP